MDIDQADEIILLLKDIRGNTESVKTLLYYVVWGVLIGIIVKDIFTILFG